MRLGGGMGRADAGADADPGACGAVQIERLYAFIYKPTKFEVSYNGWNIYEPQREFDRQGITDNWRLSHINSSYTFCDTYPAKLWVPTTISDNTLNYASKFRSRQRVPVLTYIHNVNNCTLTRCAQPLTGLQKNRSVQDEKLVHAIFKSSNASGYASLGISNPEASSSSQSLVNVEQGAKLIYGAQQTNLIVDARPSVNAYAQQAAGAGSEVMDNYKFAKKEYLGIDNIHVMRNSLGKLLEGIKDSDITPFPANRDLLTKSNWLRHITALLEGTSVIVRQVALEHSHVLIHCSDGWDRTSQLAALAQVCLDPYFRTLEGFMVLVEKDWVSFGHKFRDRCGFLGSEKWFSQPADSSSGGQGGFEQALGAAKMFFNQQASNFMGGDDDNSDPEGVDSPTPRSGGSGGKKQKDRGVNVKETSPVFHQFLDATYQLMHQNPTRFEFNERFLRRLLYHMHSCQYGTFLYNNEKERVEARVEKRTRAVWDYFLARRQEWMNPEYDVSVDADERGVGGRVIFPAIGTSGVGVRWWPEIFGRTNDEMNGRTSIFGKSREPMRMRALAADSTPATHPMPAEDGSVGGARESPVVVAEDAEGELSAVPGTGYGDIGRSAAVLGTERARELAEDEGDSAVEVIIHVDDVSACATVASSSTLDMSESVRVSEGEGDSQMSSSPPVLALDAAPEKAAARVGAGASAGTGADEPVVVESPHDDGEDGDDDGDDEDDDEEEGNAAVLVQASGDPLGGHEAVDVSLSPSPRLQGRGISGIGSRFSRGRLRGTKKELSAGMEGLELV
ncbi:hypothetical protein DRE_07727 [Drechslerella stenobrocha 248]|uniref:Myotubularin phosphatase domain-containing protein n=1 Tax=Drechslerella stenobrocha 248 TaxID=1043628 RepID=W7I8Y2_9PEZI|nr:hypothetical protein DRE_07727 [Drechslerella stenobrocha 248]